jgi:site-specific DNA-methyltransferase (adenine-specific)
MIHNDDCFNVFKNLSSESINLILVDLPYGTTACKWDEIIPFERMWEEVNRITTINAPIIFFSQQPFTSKLINSQLKLYHHELIWVKSNGSSPFHAKLMPMKKHENILIFCKSKPVYNPIMKTGKPYKWNSKRTKGEASNIKQTRETPINNTGTRFPDTILAFKSDRGLHPTQKPLLLLEYLIKTYSNEKDVVLDFTMGSGTTGVACVNTNRQFIGIELDKEYFDIAQQRIQEAADEKY